MIENSKMKLVEQIKINTPVTQESKSRKHTYKMNSNYNITAGNAGNILVIFNKEVRGKIGKYGEVVDSIILNYNSTILILTILFVVIVRFL